MRSFFGLLLLLLLLTLLSAVTAGVLKWLHLQPPAFAYLCVIYLLLIENLSFSQELEASEVAHCVTKQLLGQAIVAPPPVIFKRRLLNKMQSWSC